MNDTKLMLFLILGFLVFLVVIYVFLVRTLLARKISRAVPDVPNTEAYSNFTAKREGWYPLPDGTRDRFFDGKAWTDKYRDRVEVDEPLNDEVPDK